MPLRGLRKLIKTHKEIPFTYNKMVSQHLQNRNLGKLKGVLEEGYRFNKLDADFLAKLASEEKDFYFKMTLENYAKKRKY